MLDLEICSPALLHPIPTDGRPVSAVMPMHSPQYDMAYFLKLNNLDPQP